MTTSIGRTVLLVAALALLGAACARAASETDYGIVADPPLPIEAPTLSFDSRTDIADLDASRIVRAVNGEVRNSSSDLASPVSVSVDPNAELRAVSADGTLTALFRDRGNRTSEITVVDFAIEPPHVEVFELPGLVEPEAFSTDGGLLYVIDHTAGSALGSYRVRPLNLGTGQLEQILGPSKLPFADDMNGVGRRQVWAPDGSRLYTLYIRQTHHHHGDSQVHGHGEPGSDGFVHVLDLKEEWAFCLDLPQEFGDGDLETTALAVASDGQTIAVADLNAGQVAYASTVDLAVTETHEIPSMEIDSTLQIGLTSNYLAVGWDTHLQWLQRHTLEPRGTVADISQPLVGLTTSGRDSLLVWTAATSAPPTTLYPPDPAS